MLASSGANSATGRRRSSTDMNGLPPVVTLMMQPVSARRRGRMRAKASGDWSGRPVSGSRAWTCRIAAPARAARTPSATISSGVTGKCGDIDGV